MRQLEACATPLLAGALRASARRADAVVERGTNLFIIAAQRLHLFVSYSA